MFIVKPCPSCRLKLRFPIDRGIIKVKCRCGFSFTADPDDPALYKDGKIDPAAGPAPGFFEPIKNYIDGINFTSIKPRIINSILNFKYSAQNFSLMPTTEKFSFILKIITVLAAAVLIAALITRLSCGSPSPEDLII